MKKRTHVLRAILVHALAFLLSASGIAFTQTTKWVDQINGNDGNSGDSETTAYASLQTALNYSSSGLATVRSIIYVKSGV